MDGQGIVLFKAHHSFGDGVSAGQFFMAISDIYDANARPGLKPIPWYKMAILYILSPLLVLKAQSQFFMKSKDKNCIKNDKPMTGRKNGAYS
jgi:hypothetical protein